MRRCAKGTLFEISSMRRGDGLSEVSSMRTQALRRRALRRSWYHRQVARGRSEPRRVASGLWVPQSPPASTPPADIWLPQEHTII